MLSGMCCRTPEVFFRTTFFPQRRWFLPRDLFPATAHAVYALCGREGGDGAGFRGQTVDLESLRSTEARKSLLGCIGLECLASVVPPVSRSAW